MNMEVHIDWEGETHLVGRLRIKSNTLDAYATAFEHPLMDEAKKLS